MAKADAPTTLPPVLVNRLWSVFALHAYARIVLKKHGLRVPTDDLDDISDDEIADRLRLVSDLAHLPP